LIYDVCIIGGGASGLMAASYLSKRGKNVILLEGTKELGKKLSLTGNGRCNITNMDMRSSCFNSSDDSFVSKIFNVVSNERLLNILHEDGVSTVNLNGYLYPRSLSAKSVVSALSRQRENLTIKYQAKVREIEREDDTFVMKGDRESKEMDRPILATAKKIILCCGGASYPKTGSDGSGYKLLERMGHKVSKPLPALNALDVIDYDTKLSGVRVTSEVSLFIDGIKTKVSTGEVQFTKMGLSGICIYEISSKASEALAKGQDVSVSLNYLQDFDRESLRQEISFRFKNLNTTVLDSLNTLLPEKVLNHLIKVSGIDNELPGSKVSDSEIDRLVDNMLADSFSVGNIEDFKTAQTTHGGVSLDEIDEHMESKIVPDMFITGELLDCDGICGGYNLYLAFSSAIIAADRILNK
jgi:predicted Rossmann fold flavoprotein